MADSYDIAIVGGGLNGLTAASYSARAGKTVVVLEKAAEVGGTMGNVEFAPGFRSPAAVATIDGVHPSIIEELDLRVHGLQVIQGKGIFLASKSAKSLHIQSDKPLLAQLGRVSLADAHAFEELNGFLGRLGKALEPVLAKPLSDPTVDRITGALDLLKVGWALRKLGPIEMPEALRFLPMTVKDVLDERFETESIKALIAATALKGAWLGPRSAGSAYGLLHHNPSWAEGLTFQKTFASGGPGALIAALRYSAEALGVEIRTNTQVKALQVDNGVCSGVVLENGTALETGNVLSAVDPKTTFHTLTGSEWLNPDFMEKITQIRANASVSLVHLALDRLPVFSDADDNEAVAKGIVQIGDSLDYMERAFDSAKYGAFADQPLLTASIPSAQDSSLAPADKHVMHVWVQYTPSKLAHASWDDAKEILGDRVVACLDEHAPGLAESVVHRRVDTPLDLERQFGLTNGCLNHVDLALDQLLYMRPIPGWFKYETPIRGLYLCGAGVHPGGAGTGLSGKCAAEHVFRNL